MSSDSESRRRNINSAISCCFCLLEVHLKNSLQLLSLVAFVSFFVSEDSTQSCRSQTNVDSEDSDNVLR